MSLRFGIFLPPHHRRDQNPTLQLRADLELVERLDRLTLCVVSARPIPTTHRRSSAGVDDLCS